MDKITWHQLCCKEPALGVLLRDIQVNVKRISKSGTYFCANYYWYHHYKPALVRLVGWSSVHNDPILKSCAAYDLAYDKLYKALPDCRNCHEIGVE